jgi:hypothetical protein
MNISQQATDIYYLNKNLLHNFPSVKDTESMLNIPPPAGPVSFLKSKSTAQPFSL